MSPHAFSYETVIYYTDMETPDRWRATRDLIVRTGMEAVTLYYIHEHELRHQPIDRLAPRLEVLKRCRAELEDNGLHVAAALLPCIGWGQAVEEGPFEKIIGADGTRSGAGSCPLDPNLRNYVLEIAERLADAGFKIISLEDDFQSDNHRPVRGGCFCPRHLEAFSKQENRPWSRTQLADAIAHDAELKGRWDGMKRDILAELAQAILKSARDASLCLLAGADLHQDPTPVFKRCRIDYVRPAQGQYVEGLTAAVRGPWSAGVITHRHARPHNVRTMAEITSWPRNAFTKSWKTMMLQTAISAFFGLDGALFWAGHSLRDPGFECAVTGKRDWLDRIHQVAGDYPRLAGVHVNVLRDGALAAACMGIPVTFMPEHAWLHWGEHILDIPAMQAAGIPTTPATFFACELTTDDPVNGRFTHWPSTCLTLLKEGDFFTIEAPADARILSRFLNNDSEPVAPSVILDEAGRKLLLCHTPVMWEKLIGDAKAWQLHHAIDVIYGKQLPVTVLGAPNICPFVREGDAGLAICLANLSNDPAEKWTLRLSNPDATIERADNDGQWIACDISNMVLPPHSATLLRLR